MPSQDWSSTVRRFLLAALMVAATTGASAAPAAADRGLLLGATENRFRWDSAAAAAVARDLGIGAIRVTLGWAPGQTELAPGDAADLDRMVAAAAGLRIVLTIVGPPRGAPLDAPARDAYCAYARGLLDRYPTINDIVVWNEPNLGFFWQPQYNADGSSAAPAAYADLLARCWDVLHAARPDVNVITTTAPSGNDNPTATSNVSHAPGTFIRKMGDAYRASGRQSPLFDTIGHNPYGTSSAEAPSRQHLFPSHIGIGDLDRLLLALNAGFGGTPQPIPGTCIGSRCATIWYLEVGYQTTPDSAESGLYTGRENDARPLPAVLPAGSTVTQESQMAAAVRLAYCQPYVGAFFNFLLWDEPDLARWQSGVLAPDGSRKPSYDTLRSLADEVGRGGVDCSAVPQTPVKAIGALLDRLEWPEERELDSFNDVWGLNVVARERVSFTATLRRLDGPLAARRRAVLSATGRLRAFRPRYVGLPSRQVPRGTYRLELTVARNGPPLAGLRLEERRVSPTFTVG